MKTTPKAKIDPVALAKYLLVKMGSTDHLKLQKLLYYVEAWHLVFFDTPIIEEDFRAWVHGPVLLSVWHDLKKLSILHGEVQIKKAFRERNVQAVTNKLDQDQLELIDDVLKEYGSKSGYHLECLTHAEAPWRSARAGLAPDEPGSRKISKKLMKSFYRDRLQANGQEAQSA